MRILREWVRYNHGIDISISISISISIYLFIYIYIYIFTKNTVTYIHTCLTDYNRKLCNIIWYTLIYIYTLGDGHQSISAIHYIRHKDFYYWMHDHKPYRCRYLSKHWIPIYSVYFHYWISTSVCGSWLRTS